MHLVFNFKNGKQIVGSDQFGNDYDTLFDGLKFAFKNNSEIITTDNNEKQNFSDLKSIEIKL